MFAKQPIKKGSVLIKEQPFIYVLSSLVRTQHCDTCFKKGELLKCSNCQYVFYCGKVCQREGWLLHKGECNNLKHVAPRIVPDAARILARLIRKLNKGGNGVRSYYTTDRFRMFKDLMSHYNELKVDQRRMDHFTSLCGVLFEFLNDISIPNSVELLGIYGRMCINSFNICDSEMNPLGTGMYLATSIVDHSCEPTAIATFDGTTLYLRSLCDMDYLDWTKVCISYIDILNKPEDRQNQLEKQYYFLCKCPRCIVDDATLEIMTAATCPNNSCDGYVNMYNVSVGDMVECEKCNRQLDDDFINKYLEITELNETHIGNMYCVNYLDVCKMCLEKSNGVLHKLNIQSVKLLDASFECCINLQRWTDAKEFGTRLIEGFLFYYNDINPLVGILYLKLSKVHSFLEEREEARKYLKNAFDILQVTHGTNSTIFKTEIMPLMEQLALEERRNGF